MLLAIETSGTALSVALLHEGRTVAAMLVGQSHQHDAQLLPLVNAVMEAGTLSFERLDGIAVSEGPGSFTGLRVGMAAAKALAWAHHRPLVAVPTFDAMGAWLRPRLDGPFALATRSRAGECYLAVWNRDGEPVHPISIARDEDVASHLPQGAWILGSATETLLAMGIAARRAPFAEEEFRSATVIGQWGEDALRRGTVVDPLTCEPRYLHRFATTTPKSLFVS